MRLQRKSGLLSSSGLVRLALFFLVAIALGGCVDESEKTSDFFNPHEYGQWEYGGEPDIDGPQRMIFGDVLEGETVTQAVQVTNIGDNLLKLDQWELEGAFEMSFPAHDGQPPGELRPGEVIEISVTYTAHDTDRARGVLQVESNDPDEQFFAIELFANADFPCLELEPADRIDYGISELSETKVENIVATNCAQRSATTFEITGIDGASEFGLLDDSMGVEIELEPGAAVRIPVGFTPQTPGEYDATLSITSDDEFEPERSIELTGRGRPYDCPEPVIRAFNPDRGEAIADPQAELAVVPLDSIELDASLSRDPEGDGIDRVQWRLVERPPDGTSGLQNEDDFHSSIWMQLSGTYVVELDVWNELGVKSCEPARMTFEAISDEDIHVQLVWNTPNDPDETDGSGSDVDLHLLHPNASDHWNMAPWDCFWQNQTPDWGELGDSSDDPGLDLDDTSGAGPENINLDSPEEGATYKVGAHYFSAARFGRSYVTVRIYIGGHLAHEAANQPMDNDEFWHVANIDWPGGGVSVVDQLHSTFP